MSIRQLTYPSEYGDDITGQIAEIKEVTLAREYYYDEDLQQQGYRDVFRVRMHIWSGGAAAADGSQPLVYTVNLREGDINGLPLTQAQYDAIRQVAYDVVMADDPDYAGGTVVMD